MNENYLFTSESVTEGHPDKVADRISDAVLDFILEQDSDARVACETMITGSRDKKSLEVFISGEITTNADVDYDKYKYLKERTTITFRGSNNIKLNLLLPKNAQGSRAFYLYGHGDEIFISNSVENMKRN